MSNKEDLRYHAHEKGDGSWWENDARGIPLARVCEKCLEAKLATFRPEVLSNPNYEVDEQIEPDDWASERNQERQFSEYLESRAEAYARDYPEDF